MSGQLKLTKLGAWVTGQTPKSGGTTVKKTAEKSRKDLTEKIKELKEAITTADPANKVKLEKQLKEASAKLVAASTVS
ncbi:hypothetical protein N7462_000527 [Penicillium macrosclerotiorum]|uniref:uncharacterized protein n=1 Tax=Penicillium macrosclerotiorum TaxID=303699 RepID=UPI002546C1A9|nr:uncharacterized protein N7462_000527 [Penicillium macrosclerotiorum]KAJ5698522.1 hypothetical protein N7462_000527 [Penicillium macrosclerotiorum]